MGVTLNKEDYEEPCCPLNMDRSGQRIDTRRVITALDAYLGRNDYAAAERHLQYWILEAENAGDLHGKLTVLNEQIGLYRKTGRQEECFRAIAGATELMEALGLEGTITCGTTLINAATGFKAFGRAEEALKLYRKARTVYEETLESTDERLGTLYNNMALALTELGQYREAEAYYLRAVEIMKHKDQGQLEEAITWLNLADLRDAELGHEAAEEEIQTLLARAEALLNTPGLIQNGYYAFVCEKCAPVFGYYGFFLTEAELKERAQRIYERN